MADVNANNDINSEPDDQPFFLRAGYFLIGFVLLVILAVLSVYISQNKIDLNREINGLWHPRSCTGADCGYHVLRTHMFLLVLNGCFGL
ncbi:MAG: hypothetical protein OIN86_05410 [Candidatus Methanoperedens sp.]|nr:hypothetical protein [Candidatus Methanoperedens sp.]CAG0961712.1 hypothetical protein METP1_00755 [Methanosarcinales archaeon]